MFGLFKKKSSTEIITEAPANIEEELGLREYVSVDSLKAHLVDILEENRRLKEDAERAREQRRREDTEERKRRELSLVAADEWKKRAGEKDKEIEKLKSTIDQQDRKIEKLQREQNHWKTEAELAKAAADKERENARTQRECGNWLKNMLEHYGNWEKVTKTQLVEILKKAINEENNGGAENVSDTEQSEKF